MRPLAVVGPWQYYNGAVFHRKYHEAQQNPNATLVGDRPHHARIFRALRTAVTTGTRFAPPPTTPSRSSSHFHQPRSYHSPKHHSPKPSTTPTSSSTPHQSPATTTPTTPSPSSRRRTPVRNAPASPAVVAAPPSPSALPSPHWSLAPDVPPIKPTFSKKKPAKKHCKFFQLGACTRGSACPYLHA